MQVLELKNRRNPKGKPKQVRVIRGWSDANGQALFLHDNGIYGYKAGAPVKSEKELHDLINDPMQLKYALNWWERVGRGYSERYYAKYEEALEQAYSTRLTTPHGDHGGLDMVQYQVRPSKDRKEAAFGDPKSWAELGYEQRPEWWGMARTMDTGELYFRRVDLPEQGELDPEADAQAAVAEG